MSGILREHHYILWCCQQSQLGAQFILSIFIILYMFQVTMCPSSGETTVFVWHLVLAILCGWMSGMEEHMLLHTRQNTIFAILCGWLSGMQDLMLLQTRQNTILAILCGWLVCRSLCCYIPDRMQYLLFCVDDWHAGACAPAYQTECNTCYPVWMTVWYAGPYAAAYQTKYNTCYSVWMTGMQEHMLLHTRWNTILAILCGWLSGMQSICSCIPESHLYRITGTKCRLDTVVSPDDGNMIARNMQRKEINILRKIVHRVALFTGLDKDELSKDIKYLYDHI